MQKFIAVAGFLCLANCLLACDICGNSTGQSSMGILPKYQKNFIGIRYQFRSFNTEHPPSLLSAQGSVKNTYHSAELWGRYLVTKRINLFAFVPYNRYFQKEGNLNTETKGLGDISLMAAYIVLNTGDSMDHRWKHYLQLGGGVKLPTGKTTGRESNNPNMQSGTGSVDFPFNMLYILRHRQLGLSSELSCRINGMNHDTYKIGNKLNGSLRMFYVKRFRSFSILPSAGASLELLQQDIKNRYIQEYSGGRSFLLNTGTDLYYKDFALSMNVQTPLYENLNRGISSSSARLLISLIYLLP
jgi:hypothetical protein